VGFIRIFGVACAASLLAFVNAIALDSLVFPPELVFAGTYGLVVGLLALPSRPLSLATLTAFVIALVGGGHVSIAWNPGLLWSEDVPEALLLSTSLGAGMAMAVCLGIDRRLELRELVEWYYES
jgi:hypothetical protein